MATDAYKIVLLPPGCHDDWPEQIRAAVPGVGVVTCADRESALREIADADAAYGTVDRELLTRAGRLRWIQAPAAGPQAGWYYPELIEHPVVVTNLRGIYNDHLATSILAFVLAFARGMHVFQAQQQHRVWNKQGVPLVQLADATALLVGVGGAGAEAARRLAELGMTVLAVDPRQESAPPGVAELRRPEALPELLPRANFVIITAPETPQTQGLFNRDLLRRMRRDAYLINISRGAIVVLDDLVAALDAKEIAGAALDVFEVEPLPAEHPLWTMPGVMITPHVAGDGPYLPERRTQVLLENCRRFAAGEPLMNVVDKRNWF